MSCIKCLVESVLLTYIQSILLTCLALLLAPSSDKDASAITSLEDFSAVAASASSEAASTQHAATDESSAAASGTNAATAASSTAASGTNAAAENAAGYLSDDAAVFDSDRDSVDEEEDVLELARNMQLSSLAALSANYFDCTKQEYPKDWFDKIPGWKTKGLERGLVRLKGTQLCSSVVQGGVRYWSTYIGLPPVMTGTHT